MLSLKDRSHDKEVEFLIRWRKETERIYLSGHIRTRFNNKIDKNNTSQISFFRYLPHTNSPVCPPTMSIISTTSPNKQGWSALPPRTPRPPPPGARPPASPALRGDAAWPDWNVYFSHFAQSLFVSLSLQKTGAHMLELHIRGSPQSHSSSPLKWVWWGRQCGRQEANKRSSHFSR